MMLGCIYGHKGAPNRTQRFLTTTAQVQKDMTNHTNLHTNILTHNATAAAMAGADVPGGGAAVGGGQDPSRPPHSSSSGPGLQEWELFLRRLTHYKSG